MMTKPLWNSCLASAALIVAALLFMGVATWQYLGLQNLRNHWIDYRHQVQLQRPRPIWINAQDKARLKQLAEHGALKPVDTAAAQAWLEAASTPQYQSNHIEVGKSTALEPAQGGWRLFSAGLEFDVWLLHEVAFSQFWRQLGRIPGWFEINECHLAKSNTQAHPAGILLHCSGDLLGFGPDQPGTGAPP